MSRVLVLRALGLGDLLAGVPALRAVRRACPDHEVVLAAPEPLAPLAELAGVADRVLDTRELEPVAWPHEPPDLAVDLHGNGPRSHRLLLDLHPGRLVAFGCPEQGVPGPRWCPREHERERWCRLVRDCLGGQADPDDLGLASPPPAPPQWRGCVVVHPGAAALSRQWPPDRYAAVVHHLWRTGHRVVVTGSASEGGLATAVAEVAGLPRHRVLAGRTGLVELASVVAASRLVVSGDTGIAHLAYAFGTPTVTLFGPVDPAVWGPPRRPQHVVLWHGDGDGDPHAAHVDPALARITTGEVLAAAGWLLDRAG